jgi:ubiquitin C-terminal hydrolase
MLYLILFISKCKQAATRTTKIWNIPNILIIHLKRFSFVSGQFVKNEVDVNFEIENFDLAPYIHSKAPQCVQSKAKYNLYAVTVLLFKVRINHEFLFRITVEI